MANIWEKGISILAGNLNSGCSYLITAVFYAKLLWMIWILLQDFKYVYEQFDVLDLET